MSEEIENNEECFTLTKRLQDLKIEGFHLNSQMKSDKVFSVFYDRDENEDEYIQLLVPNFYGLQRIIILFYKDAEVIGANCFVEGEYLHADGTDLLGEWLNRVAIKVLDGTYKRIMKLEDYV
jgi:hypothetical protein